MGTPPYSLFSDGWQNRFLFSLHSSLLQKSFYSGDLTAITPSETQEILPTPVGKKYSIGLSLSTSSLFNDPDTPILLHCSSGSRSSPDISFAPSSLALFCFWEVLQNLGSDHLPILLSVPLSPVYRPNERPPSFNFQ